MATNKYETLRKLGVPPAIARGLSTAPGKSRRHQILEEVATKGIKSGRLSLGKAVWELDIISQVIEKVFNSFEGQRQTSQSLGEELLSKPGVSERSKSSLENA